MTDILKQEEIAAFLGRAFEEIRGIKKYLRYKSKEEANAPMDAPQNSGHLMNQFVFFPVEISSIVSETEVQGFVATPTESGWGEDPRFTRGSGLQYLDIRIPTGGSAPAVGSQAIAHFAGTYTTPASVIVPVYGLFGGGGGGGVTQTVIQSIGDDHLVTRTIVGSALGVDDILVAKNWKNRRTPFDGNTINGYTYIYSTAIRRSTTIAASPGFVQIEEVIPSYNVDDVIYAVNTGSQVIQVTVAGTPTSVTRVDMNNDNREFVRVGFVT